MKYSLTCLVLAAIAVIGILWSRGQGSAPSASTAAIPAPSTPRAPSPAGNSLLTQAAREVAALTSIEVKLRMQTQHAGHELAGAGTYYQLRREQDMLLKLELKLPVANQVSSLLEVSDGRFLWIRRDLPREKSLSRIDQRRVREALAKRASVPQTEQGGTAWMALGGLSKLVEGLAANFDFGEPQSQMRGTFPVWNLEGDWKPAALAELWPAEAEALRGGRAVDLAQLPEQLPQRVVVVLSRDSSLPLFPLRVEYLRTSRAGESAPIAALDLYDIRRNVDLDPRLFYYKPGDQEVADQTEAFLARLR